MAVLPTDMRCTILCRRNVSHCYYAEMPEQRARTDVRLDTSLELLLERAPAAMDSRVLATVVATAGSTYRKAGARMLIMADGSYLGLLSGGCMEADLASHARQVIEAGIPRAVEYDMRGPDDVLFGLGAGCEGAMRILLEPAGRGSSAAAALAASGRAAQSGETSSLIVVHQSTQPELPLGTYHAASELPPVLQAASRRALAESASHSVVWESAGGPQRAFAQFLAPPPQLLICGAGPDVSPVVVAARNLGWGVTVVDHRPAYALESRFPGAKVRLVDAHALRGAVDLRRFHAALVMSHHLKSDESYLRELAEAGAPDYIGLLGPRVRRERLARELGPVEAALRPRIRGPVGIDIGAITPEAIALSIITQIHAWLAGRADP
jgi:xanthine dehydrogenase accessory factor